MAESEGTSGGNQITGRQIWFISIITSLIASAIFLLLFEPLLKSFTHILLGSANSLVKYFLDAAYEDAVTASVSATLFKVTVLVATPYVAVALVVSIGTISALSRLNRLLGEAPSGQVPEEEDKPLENALLLKHRGFISWFLVTVTVLTNLAWFTLLVTSAYVSAQANATFTRRMLALSTIVSTDEYNRLNNEWAFVTSEADYEALMMHMESIAGARKQPLPKRYI